MSVLVFGHRLRVFRCYDFRLSLRRGMSLSESFLVKTFHANGKIQPCINNIHPKMDSLPSCTDCIQAAYIQDVALDFYQKHKSIMNNITF